MRVQCPNCGGPHPKWDCKAPPKKSSRAVSATVAEVVKVGVRSRPSPTGTKSTAARKDVLGNEGKDGAKVLLLSGNISHSSPAGTQAPPVDTKAERGTTGPEAQQQVQAVSSARVGSAIPSKRGRKPISDPTPRQLYQRELMRQRRARLKAERDAK